MDEIKTEWTLCLDCNVPVMYVDGFCEEIADFTQPLGGGAVNSGVEHECNIPLRDRTG